jgi:hypothetical protein
MATPKLAATAKDGKRVALNPPFKAIFPDIKFRMPMILRVTKGVGAAKLPTSLPLLSR